MLIVDDEREVAEVYALRLDGEYKTRTAYSGRAGLEQLGPSVDVVLLDRRMPGLSGDEVLAEVRDGGYEPRVIMLTAVDPRSDILDLPFDDYLCKPIEKEDLVTAIEHQLRVARHDGPLSEYLEVRSKLSLLEPRLHPESEELDRLRAKADRLESEVEGRLDALDTGLDSVEELDKALSDVDRRPG